MFRNKKSLGQHFLINTEIAFDIVEAVQFKQWNNAKVLEVGPGRGVLTQFLVKQEGIDLTLVELDRRLPILLVEQFPQLDGKIIEADILRFDLQKWTQSPILLVGNFPYNISSQILFKVIENRQQIVQMVGMFQKEVAQRIAGKPSSKAYGVLSILAQVYYDVEYLFDVHPESFDRPPKVMSGVIRLTRNHQYDEMVNYEKLRKVVKHAFLQRRKKMSNALKGLSIDLSKVDESTLHKRPDALSKETYIELSQLLT